MADASSTSADSDKEDYSCIIDISNNKNLQLNKSAAQLQDNGAEKYTLHDEF